MPLTLSNNTKLNNEGYEDSSNSYLLRSENETYLLPLTLAHFNDYQKDDYDVVLLVKKEYSENDIHQVYDKQKDTRIGWIFPIEALQSTAHNESKNEHFLKYSSVAFNLLCDGIENAYQKKPDTAHSGFELKITDFYHEDSIVFVYKKELLTNCCNDYKEYLPGFMKYGYFFQTLRNPSAMSDITKMEKAVDKVVNRVNLEKVSPHLVNEDFIYAIITDSIAYEQNTLTSFFYQYQLIELIMEKIWLKELEPLKEAFAGSTTIFDLKECLNNLSQTTSEGSRLRLLFEEYLYPGTNHNELNQSCESFLKTNGKEGNTSINKNLYCVRNFLFHNYRDVCPESKEIVNDIASSFIYTLASILINFHAKQP